MGASRLWWKRFVEKVSFALPSGQIQIAYDKSFTHKISSNVISSPSFKYAVSGVQLCYSTNSRDVDVTFGDNPKSDQCI